MLHKKLHTENAILNWLFQFLKEILRQKNGCVASLRLLLANAGRAVVFYIVDWFIWIKNKLDFFFKFFFS
jgi:hypothetical protein